MRRSLFGSLKLRDKILLSAVLSQFLIVGVAAILGLATLGSNRTLLRQATQRTLRTVSGSLENSLTELDRLTYKILSDSAIQQELGSAGEEKARQTAAYHTLYERLVLYQHEYRHLGIRDILLAAEGYDVTTAYTGKDQSFRGLRQTLIALAAGGDGKMMLYPESGEEGTLYAVRAVRRIVPFDLSITGTMIVTLDLGAFMEQVSALPADAGDYLWVMDRDGVPFYRSRYLQDSAVNALPELPAGEARVLELDGVHYFAVRGVMNTTGWGYTLLTRYQEQWQSQRTSYLVFMLALLAAVALGVLVSGAAVRSITRRTDALLDKITRFDTQMTESGMDPAAPEGGDEIDTLHAHFDGMALRIRDLVKEKYVSELLSREAQLRALEAQVNPHFLYNVLESIHSRALLAGNRSICAIVEALGRLLRVSLDTVTTSLTLREELTLVRDYITIQKERFDDGLCYTESIPEALLDLVIPKMIIQPLVENAVKYAVENGIDDVCEVRVSASLEGGDAVIRVTNTGSQFPPEMLGPLDPDTIVSHGLGIGLSNIHRRLRLTYGGSSGLSLENEKDCAVCLLRIPQKMAEEEEGEKNASHDHRG